MRCHECSRSSCWSIIETNRCVNVSIGMAVTLNITHNVSMMDSPPPRWYNLTFGPPCEGGCYGFARRWIDCTSTSRALKGEGKAFHSHYCLSLSFLGAWWCKEQGANKQQHASVESMCACIMTSRLHIEILLHELQENAPINEYVGTAVKILTWMNLAVYFLFPGVNREGVAW